MSRQKHQPWQQTVRNFTVIDEQTEENTLIVEINLQDEKVPDEITVTITPEIPVEVPVEETKTEIPAVQETVIEPKKSNKKVSNLLNEKN